MKRRLSEDRPIWYDGGELVPPFEANCFLRNCLTMTAPIRIAVTGAGGQIGYALIFRIASGGLFGPSQPVSLRLLEITPALPSLNGTLMELEDCAFPLLADVVATDQATTAFEGADWVVLVGGLPRKEGMSRADLIRA